MNPGIEQHSQILAYYQDQINAGASNASASENTPRDTACRVGGYTTSCERSTGLKTYRQTSRSVRM